MTRWRRYSRRERAWHSAIIARLDEVSRRRALTDEESLRLEHAIRREQLCKWRESGSHLWGPNEDAKAVRLRAEGKKYSEIAQVVRRSPDAVAARLRYIRSKSA